MFALLVLPRPARYLLRPPRGAGRERGGVAMESQVEVDLGVDDEFGSPTSPALPTLGGHMKAYERDIEEILITQEGIQEKIAEIGAEITRDYEGRDPLLVGVL